MFRDDGHIFPNRTNYIESRDVGDVRQEISVCVDVHMVHISVLCRQHCRGLRKQVI